MTPFIVAAFSVMFIFIALHQTPDVIPEDISEAIHFRGKISVNPQGNMMFKLKTVHESEVYRKKALDAIK